MKFFLKILVKAELAACLNDNLVRKTATKKRERYLRSCMSVGFAARDRGKLKVKSEIFTDSQTFISRTSQADAKTAGLSSASLSYYKLSIKT